METMGNAPGRRPDGFGTINGIRMGGPPSEASVHVRGGRSEAGRSPDGKGPEHELHSRRTLRYGDIL